MPGLYIASPAPDAALSALLHDYDLPIAAFTREPSAIPADLPRPAFLRAASVAALLGQPIPAKALRAYLTGESPLPANILRRHLMTRFSLMPYLRTIRTVTASDGGVLAGDALLILPVSADDTVDAPLPPGLWTELNGATHTRRLRSLRGYNETPVLVRENTLLPVSMNGGSPAQITTDDADRLTLHWFQPGTAAECTLADGTSYRAVRNGDDLSVDTNADRPFHLILHENGAERLVR